MRSPSSGAPRRRGIAAGLLALVLSGCAAGPSVADMQRVQAAVEGTEAGVIAVSVSKESEGEFGSMMVVQILISESAITPDRLSIVLTAIYNATAVGYPTPISLWCFQGTADAQDLWGGAIVSLAPALKSLGLPATGSGWEIYRFYRSDLEPLLGL